MPGDVITFRDDDHVAIVEKVDGTAVSTIEGNSSPCCWRPSWGRGGPSPSAAPPASTPETGQDATTNTTALPVDLERRRRTASLSGRPVRRRCSSSKASLSAASAS